MAMAKGDKKGNKPPKKPTGRPRKDFSKSQFENLCKIQCTLTEIADYFDMSEDTVETRCKEYYGMSFSDIFKLKRSIGLRSLRRSQFALARKNPATSIWLGKQYLGQREPKTVIDMTSHKTIDDLTDEEITAMIRQRTARANSGK
jgi:AraC-like DNA-binding protein